jgi:hypothetical protein
MCHKKLPSAQRMSSESVAGSSRSMQYVNVVLFFLVLGHRIHARVGPLVGEAAEGFSLVKCKVRRGLFTLCSHSRRRYEGTQKNRKFIGKFDAHGTEASLSLRSYTLQAIGILQGHIPHRRKLPGVYKRLCPT